MTTTILAALIREKMQTKELSVRGAAEEIGIAHTTLGRILDGDLPSETSAVALAEWLGVPASSVIDGYGGPMTDTTAAKLSLIFSKEPRLLEILVEAISRIEAGTMELETFRQLIGYILFREVQSNAVVQQRRGDANIGASTKGTPGSVYGSGSDTEKAENKKDAEKTASGSGDQA